MWLAKGVGIVKRLAIEIEARSGQSGCCCAQQTKRQAGQSELSIVVTRTLLDSEPKAK